MWAIKDTSAKFKNHAAAATATITTAATGVAPTKSTFGGHSPTSNYKAIAEFSTIAQKKSLTDAQESASGCLS